jgi:pimeloyl-ACP methyl ester carboxylesterase
LALSALRYRRVLGDPEGHRHVQRPDKISREKKGEMTMTTHTLDLEGVGVVDLSVDDRGNGQQFLLLHGGAGPQSALPFAERFAASNNVRVVTPTHPGFGGTARAAGLDGIPKLAVLYGQLLAELDLADVTVIGNSIGGWIAAELALLRSPRVSGIVLIDAVGIDVPGHPVADAFSLSLEQIMQRSFHDPTPFLVDPTALPEAKRVVMAGNRAALTAYANGTMSDPSLIGRLRELELPALVLWGDSDRIADLEYERAYAAAIPGARFQMLEGTGHMPQLETPDQVVQAIWQSATAAV